jgi:error-prone DNA polymerase
MVNPYLARRKNPQKATYPSAALRQVLERTLGVPIFQEQVMEIAMVAAGFSAGKADQLRRAMAAWKRKGGLEPFRDDLVRGMLENGYDEKFALQIFDQIKGFGEYGFPESHAASFALMVYASAWIKCRYPEVFCAAILNSQPMGFYQPAQLVRDARAHGVEVRPVDVNYSGWDCTLEAAENGKHAVRLGFRLIGGLAEKELKKLIAARGNGFASIERLAAIAAVSRFTIERLAEADAFRSLNFDRRAALWAARRLDVIGISTARRTANVEIETVEDYVATGLSLKEHPIRFFRDRLGALGAVRNAELSCEELTQDSFVTVAGLVLIRQRPGTAKGVVFLTIEDETGPANIIVWPKAFAANRRTVMTARFLAVHGRLQRVGLVIHVVAESFVDLSAHLPWLREGGDLFSPKLSGGPLPTGDSALPVKSRNFH